jgi:hypothetical protein
LTADATEPGIALFELLVATAQRVISVLDSPPAILYRGVMRLIGLAVVLAVSLILAPLAAEGQQAGKVARIGFLQTWQQSSR